MANTFRYGIDHLTTSKTISLANGTLKGVLDKEAIKKIETSKHYVELIVESEKTVYGINTGFGILANTKISPEDTATFSIKSFKAIVWVWESPSRLKWQGSCSSQSACIGKRIFREFNYRHWKGSAGILKMILYLWCPRRVV